jgi:hypothetical protein
MRQIGELSEPFRNRLSLAWRATDLLAFGLRKCLEQGYTAKDFRADLLAALVVGIASRDPRAHRGHRGHCVGVSSPLPPMK